MRRLEQTRIGRAIRAWNAIPRRARRWAVHYEHVLGTSLDLQLLSESSRAARAAEVAVLAEIDRLEPILSGWSTASELTRWLSTHELDVAVSPELADVLDASTHWRERTGGAFDPTAQSIIDRLRGSPDTVPTLAATDPAVPLWSVDRAAGTARRLTRRAISLDAIAKGYIVSRATLRARQVAGILDVALNIGGDLQHDGLHPVTVGVADPARPAENAPPLAVVRIRNAALATSGGYRRGFVTRGRRVSHIVDPRTGRPVERVASASVFAPDGAVADALSTAFSVLQPHESVALADALPDVGCLIVEQDGTTTASAAWAARAVAPSANTQDPGA